MAKEQHCLAVFVACLSSAWSLTHVHVAHHPCSSPRLTSPLWARCAYRSSELSYPNAQCSVLPLVKMVTALLVLHLQNN